MIKNPRVPLTNAFNEPGPTRLQTSREDFVDAQILAERDANLSFEKHKDELRVAFGLIISR